MVKVSLFEEDIIVVTAEVRKICKGTQSCFAMLYQQNTSLKFRVITVESRVMIIPISSKKMIKNCLLSKKRSWRKSLKFYRLCENKQTEVYDALIYGFPVPYLAKYHGGERCNIDLTELLRMG